MRPEQNARSGSRKSSLTTEMNRLLSAVLPVTRAVDRWKVPTDHATDLQVAIDLGQVVEAERRSRPVSPVVDVHAASTGGLVAPSAPAHVRERNLCGVHLIAVEGARTRFDLPFHTPLAAVAVPTRRVHLRCGSRRALGLPSAESSHDQRARHGDDNVIDAGPTGLGHGLCPGSFDLPGTCRRHRLATTEVAATFSGFMRPRATARP